MEENSPSDVNENNTTETEVSEMEDTENAKRLKTELNYMDTVLLNTESNDVEPSTSSNNCFPKAKMSKSRNYRKNKDEESSANER